MPAIGLGTYKIKGQEVTDQTLGAAIKEGYGLIDTASVYRNEAFIASTLRSNGVNRKDVFITSKLGPKDHGTEKVAAAITTSLTNLDTGKFLSEALLFVEHGENMLCKEIVLSEL